MPTFGSTSTGDDGQVAEDNDADTHSGEYEARKIAAENNTSVDDAVSDDPTGGSREQVAAKQAATQMGDQDDVNTGYVYPSGAELPTAQNVRRYPELFSQEVIDSFQVEDSHQRDVDNNIDGESIAEAEGYDPDADADNQFTTDDDVPPAGELGDSTDFNR